MEIAVMLWEMGNLILQRLALSSKSLYQKYISARVENKLLRLGEWSLFYLEND